ncbi:MAG: single-stranded DNA-binding protein [Actinomycetales bacterium]|nr:single-stranded DNA-binding protein [Actinomycetales bacterium]
MSDSPVNAAVPAAQHPPQSPQPPTVAANEVRLVGRLGARVVVRDLPSGDQLTEFSVVVSREASGRARKVDAVPCQSILPEVRAEIHCLPQGSWVEIRGQLRRRFWRGSQGLGSALAVEASHVALVAAS